VLHLFPAPNDFGTLDLDMFPRSRLVDDPLFVGFPATRRRNGFTIHALVNRDDVTGLRQAGRGGDRLQHPGGRTVVGIVALRGNMKLGGAGHRHDQTCQSEKGCAMGESVFHDLFPLFFVSRYSCERLSLTACSMARMFSSGSVACRL